MRDTHSVSRPPAPSVLLDLTLLANRLSLGALFFLAGVSKIRMGVGTFYEKFYVGLRPAWLPEAFSSPYGHAVPFLELGLGALLIVGFLGRLTAWLIALMLVSFSIALWQAGMFNKGPEPFNTNILFFTLATLLGVLGPGRISVDGFRRKAAAETRNRNSMEAETPSAASLQTEARA